MKTKGMIAWIALIAMIMGGFTTPPDFITFLRHYMARIENQ